MNNDLLNNVNGFVDEIENAYQGEDFWDWLNDNAYDIEVVCSIDKNVRNIRILLAGGGPTIWWDCGRSMIEGYWGSDSIERQVDDSVSEEVFAVFEEDFLMR